MINIGDLNNLKVVRRAEFGYYLDAGTGNTSDDVLLPMKSTLGRALNIDDEVEAFVYRDSSDRLISTLKKPLAKVGDLAYLKVVDMTTIGSFVEIGLERDVLVPFKEENYSLETGRKYLFYIYLDKTGRIAATTFVDKYLYDTDSYNIDDEVEGTVYGIQTNGTVMVAIDDIYRGVILRNENYMNITPGDRLKARVKKYYEDGKMDLTVRKPRLEERDVVEEQILEYLKNSDGSMPYNDKSSPDDIKKVFKTSKNAFKRALGGLMKSDLILQNEEGTRLK
ncbi:DNA-binding protein [Clostridium tagluense]|uniref:DNA-binding protein n=1 Tax=Clostridium tagluense TaxID=360422 RepID=A0A401URG4_9CLOT|nr:MULTISPECIES: S1-like domain-containing RNA-binding protein [Clostridium]MBU3130080.1 DNA-binding protein [Clostridium tagluense]MBZ9625105.1 DNA-binding protein [Clostridium sp. FP2]MCB2313739.1 DNA-binding protein [Clostridium tagluense]MCB2318519.1 DNA-binding protein [Clostridium tagluense]MCB2323401.1 DNA-binding protein [Clostridium tagluense]